MARRERETAQRLDAARGGQKRRSDGPEMAGNPRLELAERIRAIPHGGIGTILKLARDVGLVDKLDAELGLIKRPQPYTDSDHVLNIVFNALCGGRVLDDIELRRSDTGFLDALGARSIPDPTTAGDYCRRFEVANVYQLMQIANDVRILLWRQQGREFLSKTARIDVDGSLIRTYGECKEGMDVTYAGVWGYHPLVVSLANTQEPLWILNRSGNRPSHEGAAELLDRSIALVRRAGFEDVLLRGDTDFSQTAHLDRWDDDGVRFVFGYDAHRNLVNQADALGETDYQRLEREADRAFTGKRRAKQPRIKKQIVRARGFKNLVLSHEDVAEFEYTPRKAGRPYRIIALRKTIEEERGQLCLDTHVRYFFYITNDRTLSPAEVVREANDRCNQERLIEQLKGGVRALHAPLNTLVANWAYMVIMSLAWSLKAWFAMRLPVAPRWRDRHLTHRDRILRMEFRTWVQTLICIPAQVLHTGRRLVLRFLAWRPELEILFRLDNALDSG